MQKTTQSGGLWIVAAASGTGKTSLVKALLNDCPQLTLSISHTTRPPRPNEVDGRDYHFVDRSTYEKMVADGAFLENAWVFDNGYGTAKATVVDAIEAGKEVLLEIDWQGAIQVRTCWPTVNDIFILPPSREALAQRLRARATDTEAVIERRLQDSVTELSHWHEFRYCIVNDNFDQALSDLKNIVSGHGEAYLSNSSSIQALAHRLLA
jgi:guanylate kinase